MRRWNRAACWGLSVLLTAVGAGPALHAQQPAPPAAPSPAAPAAPAGAEAKPGAAPAPALVFAGEAGMVIFTVKAEGAPDFEAFFAKVKEALASGKKPEYKQMAAGWTLYKVTDAPQSGQVLYACLIDPAVKTADYDPVKILMDVLPNDAATLLPKLKDALLGANRLTLQPALKMAQTP